MGYTELLNQKDCIKNLGDHPVRFISEKGLLKEFRNYLLGIIDKEVDEALSVVLLGRGAGDDD